MAPSPSPSPSPSHGGNENGHKQIQDAAPFDDTMVLDYPLVETQLLVNLDFETQAVDDSDCFEDKTIQSFCEYEKEVVLDSEDEGVSRAYTLQADNLLLDCNASISELCGVGEKGCRVTVERTDMQKDLVIGSQEPGDSSQANALEFVGKFLSLNKMDLSPEFGIKKTVGEKSSPFSSVKRSQSLARRLKFSEAPVTRSGTFEWVDNDLHGKVDVFSKRTKAPFEFGAVRQESDLKDHKATHINGEGGRSSGNENEKRKELVNLHKEIAGSTHSDPKDDCRIKQVSKMDIQNHSDKEINEDLHVESSERQLDGCGAGIDTPDMFDVGFNTQIAAEVMEALSTGCTAFNADQGQSNTTKGFPKGVIMKKARSEHALIQTSNFCGLGSIATKSKRRKHSARKSAKDSNKVPDPELPMLTKVRRGKSLISEQFDCCANTNGNSGRRSPTLIVKGQAVGTVSKNHKVKVYENHMTSSILVKQEEVGLRNITVAQESRQSLAGGTLKRTKKQSDNPRNRMEDGTIKYRRKRSRLVGNPTDVMGTSGSWSTLHSNSLAEPKSNILGQKEETGQEIAALTSCLNLAAWSNLKGKRTLREMQSHLNVDLRTTVRKEGNHSCMKSQRGAKDNSNTSFYKDMKGKPWSVNDSSPLKLPEKDSGKYFDEPDSAVPFANNESAIISKEISPGRYLEPPGSGYISTINFTNGTNASSSSHVPSKYHRKPLIRNLPKSSLQKELIRLDIPESIPDFTWKDLRRQRDMSHVRVLFSQHLDDDVIKQQKKISARLGISIATCPGDATHFIADRFVRTRNMMETIALGKPVVTHLWLESCRQASCLIDEKNYILRDAKKEREIGFSMPVSYARANQHPLLKQGQRVFITTSIKPNKEIITDLVKAVHGQVIEVSQISVVKEEKFQENPLILSCEEDHAICVPFLDKGIAAYSSELLLNGIVIQKLEFERHRLFKYHAKRHQPRTKSRRGGVYLRRSLY